MPEDSKTATTSDNSSATLIIPDEIKAKFPKIVELIQNSQSMNNEERQYWIDVLPIMTDDQMNNLRNILDNEKKQIEEAENEYKEGVKEDAKHFNLEFNEIKYREKKKIRIKEERKQELAEQKSEAALLAELENI